MNMRLTTVAAALSLVAAGACAQDFPARPIRVITTAAGGGGDLVARVVTEGISGPLGQPVIVDNRSGFIPGLMVAQAPPNGYTLGVVGGSVWLAPLQRELPY